MKVVIATILFLLIMADFFLGTQLSKTPPDIQDRPAEKTYHGKSSPRTNEKKDKQSHPDNTPSPALKTKPTLRESLFDETLEYNGQASSIEFDESLEETIATLEDFANSTQELLLLSHAYATKLDYRKALQVLEEVRDKETLDFNQRLYLSDLHLELEYFEKAELGYLDLLAQTTDNHSKLLILKRLELIKRAN